MIDDFQPVSDDEGVPTPEVPETGFVDGTADMIAESQTGYNEGQSFTEEPVETSLNETEAETTAIEEPLPAAPFAEEPVEVVEVPTLQVHIEPSFWEKLRRLISEDGETRIRRIRHLDRAIEASPTAAANYVQRGELYLQNREYELALSDFEQGLELAEAQFETDDWGIIAQAVRDRALNGWQKAARQLKMKRKKVYS